MEAIVERCAGIDIGQATVVVTVLVGAAHQRPRKTTRTFRTITRELLELREWLRAEQVTHVGIAYASHCTSFGRCETFSSAVRLFDNLTPLAFSGGSGPGSSYRYSSLSLQR
jgi:hypothetical protein